jgi:hypothetical protein
MTDPLLAEVVRIHAEDPDTAFVYLSTPKGDLPTTLSVYQGPPILGNADGVPTWRGKGYLDVLNVGSSGLLFRPNRRAYEAVGATWTEPAGTV